MSTGDNFTVCDAFKLSLCQSDTDRDDIAKLNIKKKKNHNLQTLNFFNLFFFQFRDNTTSSDNVTDNKKNYFVNLYHVYLFLSTLAVHCSIIIG